MMKRSGLNIVLAALLICFATAVLAQQTITAEAPSNSNSIRSIDISTFQNGEVIAKLTLDRPLPAPPAGVALDNPPHLF